MVEKGIKTLTEFLFSYPQENIWEHKNWWKLGLGENLAHHVVYKHNLLPKAHQMKELT